MSSPSTRVCVWCPVSVWHINWSHGHTDRWMSLRRSSQMSDSDLVVNLCVIFEITDRESVDKLTWEENICATYVKNFFTGNLWLDCKFHYTGCILDFSASLTVTQNDHHLNPIIEVNFCLSVWLQYIVFTVQRICLRRRPVSPSPGGPGLKSLTLTSPTCKNRCYAGSVRCASLPMQQLLPVVWRPNVDIEG